MRWVQARMDTRWVQVLTSKLIAVQSDKELTWVHSGTKRVQQHIAEAGAPEQQTTVVSAVAQHTREEPKELVARPAVAHIAVVVRTVAVVGCTAGAGRTAEAGRIAEVRPEHTNSGIAMMPAPIVRSTVDHTT